MSSANLDLVRSIYAAWDRGDYRVVEWADADIEFVIVDGPEPGSWTGLAGMVEGGRTILDPWEGWRPEAEEYRELDDERILVLTRRRGRGKTSELEIGRLGTGGASLFHIRDGKVTRHLVYWDRAQALADLGLPPSTSSSSSSPRG